MNTYNQWLRIHVNTVALNFDNLLHPRLIKSVHTSLQLTVHSGNRISWQWILLEPQNSTSGASFETILWRNHFAQARHWYLSLKELNADLQYRYINCSKTSFDSHKWSKYETVRMARLLRTLARSSQLEYESSGGNNVGGTYSRVSFSEASILNLRFMYPLMPRVPSGVVNKVASFMRPFDPELRSGAFAFSRGKSEIRYSRER